MTYLILICIVAPGCNTNTTRESVLEIDPDKRITKTLDDYIDQIDITPLETHESALLRSIWKVIENRGHILVQNGSRGLYIFGDDGRFIRQIGSIGSGPGEYIYIADFQVNKFTGNIEIMDCFGRIKIFSPEGEFINKGFAFGLAQDFETDRYLIRRICYKNDFINLFYDKMQNDYEILQNTPDGVRLLLDDPGSYRKYPDNIIPASEAGSRLPKILNWDSGSEYLICSVNSQNKAWYINPSILDNENLMRFNNLGIEDNPVLLKLWFKN